MYFQISDTEVVPESELTEPTDCWGGGVLRQNSCSYRSGYWTTMNGKAQLCTNAFHKRCRNLVHSVALDIELTLYTCEGCLSCLGRCARCARPRSPWKWDKRSSSSTSSSTSGTSPSVKKKTFTNISSIRWLFTRPTYLCRFTMLVDGLEKAASFSCCSMFIL